MSMYCSFVNPFPWPLGLFPVFIMKKEHMLGRVSRCTGQMPAGQTVSGVSGSSRPRPHLVLSALLFVMLTAGRETAVRCVSFQPLSLLVCKLLVPIHSSFLTWVVYFCPDLYGSLFCVKIKTFWLNFSFVFPLVLRS